MQNQPAHPPGRAQGQPPVQDQTPRGANSPLEVSGLSEEPELPPRWIGLSRGVGAPPLGLVGERALLDRKGWRKAPHPPHPHLTGHFSAPHPSIRAGGVRLPSLPCTQGTFPHPRWAQVASMSQLGVTTSPTHCRASPAAQFPTQRWGSEWGTGASQEASRSHKQEAQAGHKAREKAFNVPRSIAPVPTGGGSGRVPTGGGSCHPQGRSRAGHSDPRTGQGRGCRGAQSRAAGWS